MPTHTTPSGVRLGALLLFSFMLMSCGGNSSSSNSDPPATALDTQLTAALAQAGFTGKIESTFQSEMEKTLGRPLDPVRANLGRLLFFDKIHSLHQDNTCAGCHSPTNGFGDSQSIAIGIQNNNLVGPHRTGPRNQRRAPLLINTALYPSLFSDNEDSSISGDPLDNSQGFQFTLPEGNTRFPPNDPNVKILLQAQGQFPPTELDEVTGYTGSCGTIFPVGIFCQFDDGKGLTLPPPTQPGYVGAGGTGYRNDPIRAKILTLINANPTYVKLFGQAFPQVAAGAPVDFTMFGKAIAEFEFSIVYDNTPLDQYAQGNSAAMSDSEKRGALIFFGKGNCVACHAVAGKAHEMFSDFKGHVIGVPQLVPLLGAGKGDVVFDGPNGTDDYGIEDGQVLDGFPDNPDFRYQFRTSPLRNLAAFHAYFHDGAFTDLSHAIRFHLNPAYYAPIYDPVAEGVASDLSLRLGPIQPILARLDPLLQQPVVLSDQEFADLVNFIEYGLLDPRAMPQNTCTMIPSSVPSGMPMLQFEGCSS
jgi:cytochrome c peroxidase